MPAHDILDLRDPEDRVIFRIRIAFELRHRTVGGLNAELPAPMPRGTPCWAIERRIADVRIAKAIGEEVL
jgi:hypothetical protein